MATIKLNVGGKHFETTKLTIKNSTYLTSFIARWTKPNEIPFIDRSPKIFEHVLSYLRDPNYPFPDKYVNELEYYGINHDIEKQNTLNDEIKQLNDLLNSEIIKLNDKMTQITATMNDIKIVYESDKCKYCTGNKRSQILCKFHEEKFKELQKYGGGNGNGKYQECTTGKHLISINNYNFDRNDFGGCDCGKIY